MDVDHTLFDAFAAAPTPMDVDDPPPPNPPLSAPLPSEVNANAAMIAEAMTARIAMEKQLLDAEPARVSYFGAGRVYSTVPQSSRTFDNPYTPFRTKLEWEFSIWVDRYKIGSNVLDALLGIEGVSEPMRPLSHLTDRSLSLQTS